MSIHIIRDDALSDKSILVTGGGGGLGKEIGKTLAAKGEARRWRLTRKSST